MSSQTRTEMVRNVMFVNFVLDGGIPNYDPFFTKMILIVAGPMFGKCAPLSVLLDSRLAVNRSTLVPARVLIE